MSTASELLVDTGDISQGSPSQPPDGGVTSSHAEGAISQGGSSLFSVGGGGKEEA